MYQQITLIGNLGNDPEMRYTASGVPVTSFSLAVTRRWNSQDGQRQEKTLWFRVSAWRKTAEIASQYLTKGSKVLVVGEVEEARAYTDRDGNLRAALEVTAQNIQFLTPRGEQQGGMPVPAGAPAVPDNGGVSDEDIPF